MKNCTKCGELKSLTEYPKLMRNKDGHDNRCKTCKRLYDNTYYRDNPGRQKYITNKTRAIKQDNQQYIYDYLLDHPCECGEADPAVLQFDHNEPKDKRNNIAAMVALSRESIDLEIAKCTVRCANCHARRTAKQFGWYRNIRTR